MDTCRKARELLVNIASEEYQRNAYLREYRTLIETEIKLSFSTKLAKKARKVPDFEASVTDDFLTFADVFDHSEKALAKVFYILKRNVYFRDRRRII